MCKRCYADGGPFIFKSKRRKLRSFCLSVHGSKMNAQKNQSAGAQTLKCGTHCFAHISFLMRKKI